MTEFERKMYNMKKKLSPIKFYAWMDKEMDNFFAEMDKKKAILDSHPQESVRPMTIEEKAIFKYKSNNLIPNEVEVTFDDVLYEECGTDRDVYLQRTNAFCDLGSNITLSIRNGVKTPV
jgi:CRISPR/Cas system-associated exonuclease Cas4 (RecB family)